MPDSPDFDQIAMAVGDRAFENPRGLLYDIKEQLRLIWNARGAADIATIETAATYALGSTDLSRVVKALDQAIRKLDR